MTPPDGRSVVAPKPALAHASGRRRFALRWIVALGVGLAVLVVMASVYSRHSYPRMPGKVSLQLTLPAGIPGESEPIIETGMYAEGDLVVIRYLDARTAEFGYDHWGFGGPRSEKISFEPGSRHSLEITLPSLTTFHKPAAGARGLVRLVFDGREILRDELHYHGRLPKQVYFGENAIGGSARASFRGKIARPNGHVVRGGPECYFTRTERLSVWVRARPWQAIGVVLASVAAAALCGWLAGNRVVRATFARIAGALTAASAWPTQPDLTEAPQAADVRLARVRHLWFVASMVVAAIGYAWLVTLGTFNFNYAEVFGSFYDYQAASFLKGRLDVPEEAIEGEAFEAGGKLYGYFGPTPALLRLPFTIAGVGFGKLSRAFMLLYFIASLGAAYLLLRDAVKLARLRSGAGPAEPSAFATVVMVASTGFASTVFFLGSRGLIFHEAILAGITFSLWSCWCALRHLQAPARRWWLGALVGGVLSLHARPPTGLFALTLLGCVVVALAIRDWRATRPSPANCRSILLRHAGVAALCFAGLLTLNGLAYLKFKTFDPAPLRLSRPYQGNDRLAHIDGKSFHAANLPYNFYTYVLRPNFRVERGFPWIYLGSPTPGRTFPRAKIDLADHTLAMPYAMPSLFLLATLGGLAAFIAFPLHRWPLVVIWLAAVPLTIALFAAIATAQRYTGDFCPLLICSAAFGLAALEFAPGAWRAFLRSLTALVTLAGIAVTVALTLHYQGAYLWGVPAETQHNYQELRRRVDAWLGVSKEMKN